MLSVTGGLKIFLAVEPADMRKGFGGLYALDRWDGLTMYVGNGEMEIDPDLVKFEMDVLWVIHPGQDPVALLKKYPNRWVLMHLKDLRKGVKGDFSGDTSLDNDVALGSGQADYPAILRTAQEIGIKHFFIEDESPVVLQQIPKSLNFLSSVR